MAALRRDYDSTSQWPPGPSGRFANRPDLKTRRPLNSNKFLLSIHPKEY
jgi:hypothetical protein